MLHRPYTSEISQQIDSAHAQNLDKYIQVYIEKKSKVGRRFTCLFVFLIIIII